MAARVDWKALEAAYAAPAPLSAQRVGFEDAAARHVAALDAWDAAEERAAIMEYCGGLTREEAERLAFATVNGVCWWSRRLVDKE